MHKCPSPANDVGSNVIALLPKGKAPDNTKEELSVTVCFTNNEIIIISDLEETQIIKDLLIVALHMLKHS